MRARPVGLHVPVHGDGRAFARLARAFGARILRRDLTELSDLDDLFAPSGPIAESQRGMARAFGVDRARFLVGGASAGLKALVWALPRGTVAVPRDVHRSVVSAAAAAGHRLRVLPTRFDPRFGIPLGPTAEDVAATLAIDGSVRAVVVHHPTYHGVVGDLDALTAVCRERGVAVLVDSAHGAHFGLHPDLPEPAYRHEVDAVVMGMHKSGGALTQGALLLLRGDAVAPERLEEGLALFQSSSPSYLLMASVELAAADLVEGGPGLWARAVDVGLRARKLADRVFSPAPGQNADPTRITVLEPPGSETPSLVAEYRGGGTALYVVGPGIGAQASRRLLTHLRGIVPASPDPLPWDPAGSEPLDPRGALLAQRAWVAPERAAGRVSAGIVSLSPPCVPLALPGETWTPRALGTLTRGLSSGRVAQGLGAGGTVPVVAGS